MRNCGVMRHILEMLADHSKLDAQVEKTNEEIALVSSLGSACVRENAEKAQAQEEYNDRYDSLVNRYQKAMARLEKLNVERGDRQNCERELLGFIDVLTTSPLVLDTWDEQLWRLLVVRGIANREGSIEFELRNRGI